MSKTHIENKSFPSSLLTFSPASPRSPCKIIICVTQSEHYKSADYFFSIWLWAQCDSSNNFLVTNNGEGQKERPWWRVLVVLQVPVGPAGPEPRWPQVHLEPLVAPETWRKSAWMYSLVYNNNKKSGTDWRSWFSLSSRDIIGIGTSNDISRFSLFTIIQDVLKWIWPMQCSTDCVDIKSSGLAYSLSSLSLWTRTTSRTLSWT